MMWINWNWPYDDEVTDKKNDKETKELADLSCDHKYVNVSLNQIKIECYYCGHKKPEDKGVEK
jgi:hypothetical protein